MEFIKVQAPVPQCTDRGWALPDQNSLKKICLQWRAMTAFKKIRLISTQNSAAIDMEKL